MFCVFKDQGWTPDGKGFSFYLNTEMFAFNHLHHLMAVWLYIRQGKTSKHTETA